MASKPESSSSEMNDLIVGYCILSTCLKSGERSRIGIGGRHGKFWQRQVGTDRSQERHADGRQS
jgi:hypothetical protein